MKFKMIASGIILMIIVLALALRGCANSASIEEGQMVEQSQ